MKGKKMLAKKSKILLSAFSILTFAMSMPSSIVFADDNDTVPYLTFKNGKGYIVDVPPYLKDNNNLVKKENDKFDIYTAKINYNDKYGVVIIGLQAKEALDQATFSAYLENGEIARSVSDKAVKDTHWYVKDLMDSYQGGAFINAPVSFAEMKGIYAGEFIQFGLFYKLENENKVNLYYSFDGTFENISAESDKEKVDKKAILGGVGSSVENLKVNNKVEFKTLEELIEESEKNKEASNADSQNPTSSLDKKYSSKKSEAKIETKTKYPWLFPSAIGGSILILLIAGLFGVRYIKK